MGRCFPNWVFALITALAAAAAWSGIAQAEDCTLQQVADLPMIDDETGSPVVPIKIGDQPRQLLLDTGGFWSMLDPSVATSFGPRASPLSGALGPGAIPLTRIVTVPSIQVGAWTFRNADFFIGPAGYIGRDGTLGANFLKAFDVEIDPVDDKVRIFTQDHCDGKVVHWSHSDLAIVPVDFDWRAGWITIPMTLDGKEVKALIDTGSAESSISLRAARHLFDLTPDSPGVERTGATPGKGGRELPTYRYRFKSLEMEGIAFKGPWLGLYTAVSGAPDLILGMHELHGLHLYFAYGERKLYATTARGDLTERQAEDKTRDPSAARRPDPLDRTNAADLLRTAGEELQKGDYDRAAADVDRAMQFDPGYAPTYAMRASLDAMKGVPDRSFQDLAEAIRLDPNYLGAYMERSHLYSITGQYDHAVADADQAVRMQPGSPMTLNNRCWIRAIMGRQLDSALADCNAALAIMPKSPSIHDSRALVNLKAGRVDQAIEDYDFAIDGDPKMAPSLYGRGLAKRQKGDKSADPDIAAAERIDPQIAQHFGK